MTQSLLSEHQLEFLSLKGDCTGSSESTLVKMPHCWKSHVTAQFCVLQACYLSIVKEQCFLGCPDILLIMMTKMDYNSKSVVL